MGFLIKADDESELCLNTEHHFGRANFNDTVLNSSDISRSHATIFWSNDTWYLKDTSKNGTLVNGKKIFQKTVQIKKGSILQFGINQSSWSMIQDTAPSSFLLSIDGSKTLKLSDYHLYPNDNQPKASFFKTSNKEWKMDTGNSVNVLVEGEEYLLEDQSWLFFKNDILDETEEDSFQLENVTLEFSISPDEEQVSLNIKLNEYCIYFGKKVFNQLLLLIAREKNKGIDWVRMEDLKKKLRKELLNPSIDEYYINVQVHRLRNFLMNYKPFGPSVSDIILRKNGFLGLKFDQINIVKETF